MPNFACGSLPGGPVLDVVKPLDGWLGTGYPVASTTACRAVRAYLLPSPPGYVNAPWSPVIRPRPLISSIPVSWTHLTWLSSFQFEVKWSRRLRTAATSQGAGDSFLGPGNGLRAVQGGARPQERLRGHAGPVGTLAADQLRLDQDRRQAATDHPVRHVLAHGPRANDNDIEFPSGVPSCQQPTPGPAAGPGHPRRDLPHRRGCEICGRCSCRTGGHGYCWDNSWGRSRPWRAI